MNGQEGQAVFFWHDGSPPGENKHFDGTRVNGGTDVGGGRAQEMSGDDLEWQAQGDAETGGGEFQHENVNPEDIDFLSMVRDAESLSAMYVQQANRRAWTSSYRAYHNEHAIGSRYTHTEWRGRSKLFIPKTRAAVRKDGAAVAASLFNSIDAIDCLPGNEADPKQKAGAALIEEVVNYRVGGRAPGKASLPWFMIAMGARQDAVLTGVCCSKQYWLQKFRKTGKEPTMHPHPVTGVPQPTMRDVYTLEIDRPDSLNIPPENYTIDTSADWRNPVQSSSYFIVHWPMQIEEIREKQNSPVNPWLPVSEANLKSSAKTSKFDTETIRRARESGLDRMDETQTGTEFQVIWVSEVFMRTGGEDWTFYCAGSQFFLTEPKPVRDVYPEQHGDRPITLGYGSLEAHRIYPMAPAESWQPLQAEANDLRNLTLDAIRQNVMPVSKVVRGRQIDLDQVRRRSSGTSIMVQEKDDVTWEKVPDISSSVINAGRELSLEFDDLAGQQNYGNVENSQTLGKTLGGLKLAAGAANAVQEYDIRVWIETWATPTLQQIVRLEQYYESDKIILGICGARAQLWQKHGISEIDDELLENDVTVRVSVGLGAGDPQQRLSKFNTAAQIVAPLCAQSPDFQSGKRRVNIEAIIEEVFGACGYKDGGSRFFIEEQNPPPNAMQDLQSEKIKSEITKNDRTGQSSLYTGLAALAAVDLGRRELEASVIDNILGRQIDAKTLAFEHAHRTREHGLKTQDQELRSKGHDLKAQDSGHKHGMDITNFKAAGAKDARGAAMETRKQDHTEQSHADEMKARQAEAELGAADGDGGAADQGNGGSPAGKPPAQAVPQAQPSAAPSQALPAQAGNGSIMELLQKGEIEFTRDDTGRISGFRLAKRPGGPSARGRPNFPAPQMMAA